MIKLIEFLGKTNLLGKPFRGRVVDNNDPMRLQRVKCIIDGLFVDDIENLPWIYPKNSSSLGARQDVSSLAIPSLQSELVIEFPTGDIYAGFYTGTWISEDTRQGTFDEDYPNTYGHTDDAGNTYRVNKLKGFTEYRTAHGVRVRFNRDSVVEVKARKQINLISEDLKTKFLCDFENGIVSVSPRASFELNGIDAFINSQRVTFDVATLTEKVSGAKTVQALAGINMSSGGGYSESVVGSKSVTIGGDKSALIAGKEDKTIGLGKKETIVFGDIDIKALAGGVVLGNLLASLKVGLSGDINLSNLLGGLTIDQLGNIKLDSKALLELTGLLQTKLGSPTGVTEIDGALVTLGGPTGLPVARLFDMSVGIGNQGAPVVSYIMQGSFKVLAT